MTEEKLASRRWTEDETILAMWLYFQLPFGKLHAGNPEIQRLAQLIERSDSSVAMKLCNFASLDPKITGSGRKGLGKTSRLDRSVYARFGDDWEGLIRRAHDIVGFDYHDNKVGENQVKEDRFDFSPEASDRETTAKRTSIQRVGQNFFRRAVLANYEGRCCITGIAEERLLVASHIKPWSVDVANRLNPANGFLFSATFDRAFDTGFLTIDCDHRVHISQRLMDHPDTRTSDYFSRYDALQIHEPSRFNPDPDFLKWHRKNCFHPHSSNAAVWPMIDESHV